MRANVGHFDQPPLLLAQKEGVSACLESEIRRQFQMFHLEPNRTTFFKRLVMSLTP